MFIILNTQRMVFLESRIRAKMLLLHQPAIQEKDQLVTTKVVQVERCQVTTKVARWQKAVTVQQQSVEYKPSKLHNLVAEPEVIPSDKR